MDTSQLFHDVVRGTRTGGVATCVRGVLRCAELAYTPLVRWRNAGYDRNPDWAQRVEVPVICVGNLTMGGTGKTPLVRYLAQTLQGWGYRVALVSRGYGARAGELNDEARELAEALPDVPHVQDADRVAAARRAMEEYAAEVILLDDGFQHRRLGRDLDIVLVDAREPFGLGHLAPRGLLREPLEGVQRAHVVGLTRADQVSASRRAEIQERYRTLHPELTWLELAHQPRCLRGPEGEQALAQLQGERVLAFCGIGNPQAFRQTLGDAGAEVRDLVAFPDHHCFTAADAKELYRRAAEVGATQLICTHKDWVKWDPRWRGELPVAALVIELSILSGEPDFHAAVRGCLASAASTAVPAAVRGTSDAQQATSSKTRRTA